MKLSIFLPLCKADESQRLVWGTAAIETPDQSGEIMDYATAKPAFQKWSDDIAAATGGASLGNVRLMHGKVAIGKVVELKFDDLRKAVDVCVKVVDDNAWKLVKEGVLSGFSIGGGYAKRWADSLNKALTRYTPILSELSLVDKPCQTPATFALIKADGVTEDVSIVADGHLLKAAEEIDPEARLAAALRKASGGKTLMALADDALANTLAKADGDLAGRQRFVLFGDLTKTAALMQRIEAVSLEKGFYTVSSVARQLASFADIASSVAWEEKDEGDANSKLPQGAVDIVAAIKGFLLEMVSEETSEFLENIKRTAGDVITLVVGDATDDPVVMEMATKLADLAKDDAALTLLKAGARNSKSDMKHVQSAHDHMASMGAKCDAGNCEKVAETGELETLRAENGRLKKAVGGAAEKIEEQTGALATMTKSLADLTDRLTKVEAQPIAPKGVVIGLVKGADLTGDDLATEEPGEQKLGKVVFSADAATRRQQSVDLLKRAGFAPGG